MRIKKFNELFDTEELKADNEIQLMQGKLITGGLKDFSKDDIEDIIEKVEFVFPFLDKFSMVPLSEKHKNIAYFQVRNENWYTNVAFSLEDDNRYGLGMLYKHVDTPTPSPGDNNLKRTLTFSGKQYCYFCEWNDLKFPEVIELVNTYYTPLIKRLGFTDIINHNKEISNRRYN